jgi:methanogenic corrinoid protein MtbC1
MSEPFLIRYMQPLLAGRRAECFDLVAEAVQNGISAEELICDVVWPAMSQIERLYDDDRINGAVEHMACRINRTVADQLQAHLPKRPLVGKRVLVASADNPGEELGAQIVADLFQSSGWEVFFIGGGVPDDEILMMVGQLRPQLMLIFGAHPEAVANTRAMIERIRDIGVCPTMNILVTGGIFNRADGLWQEIGADAFAGTPRCVLETAGELAPREPNTPHMGIVKKRRRRRKSTLTPAT